MMPVGTVAGLPFWQPESAGAREDRQLKREQLSHEFERQHTLGEIQRQNVLGRKLEQVGNFIKLRQPDVAQRMIDADPELSQKLGTLNITERGGRFNVVTENGVTIVEGPDGEWKTVSQPKPGRPTEASLALEAAGGDPGRALGLLQKPTQDKVSVGDLQGAVLQKFLKGGRAGLTVPEQAVADRLLLDPDISLALRLLDKDISFSVKDAPEKAKIISETVRNLKEGRAPGAGVAAEPIPSPAIGPRQQTLTARPTKQEAAENLRKQGFTEDELRSYGLVE